MTVPYTFANQTGNIALSELDANFANVKAASDTAGTVTASAQPVITSVGQLTSLTASGNIRTLSGGIYAPGYYWANGVSILTSISNNNYGNSNVAAYLPTYTGALTNLTGNVSTTGYINAVGAVFSGPATISGNVQGGNLVTNGVINASRTITGGNLIANGAVSGLTVQATAGDMTASGNIVGANFTTSGNVVAGQRVQAGAFLTAGLVQGSDLYSTGPVRGAQLVSSGNLTVGTSASIGTNLSVVGNVTANAFVGDGSQLTGIVSNTSPAADKLTGNILSANVIYSSLKTVGNLTSLGVDTTITAQGNINTAGNLTSSGNVTGAYILGNGSQLTGINLTPSQNASLLTGSTLSANVTQSSLTLLGTLTGITVNGNASISGTATLQNITATNGTYSSQLSGATIVSAGEIRGATVRSNGSVIGSNLAITGSSSLSGPLTVSSPASFSNLTVSGQTSLQSATATSLTTSSVTSSGQIRAQTLVSNTTIEAATASLTGNLSAAFLLGNGSQLTGLYSNASVASYLPTYNGALNPSSIAASGNISGQYILGNGALLSGISTTSSLINGNSNVVVTSNGNVSMAANGVSNILTVVNANLGWNSNQLEQVIVEGALRSTTGIRSPSIDARSNIYSTINDGVIRCGSLSLEDGNGNVTALNGIYSDNVLAGYFIGDGSNLYNISTIASGNSNVAVTNNGNVSISANGNANIFTVVNANLGWNSNQLEQVIVQGALRSTTGVRSPSIDARSNIYSTVNDGTIGGGSLSLTDTGSGNGNVTAKGINSGNILFLNGINGVQISSAAPFRLPSMTNAQRNAFSAAAGDMIWNTDSSNVQVYNGSIWGNITLS